MPELHRSRYGARQYLCFIKTSEHMTTQQWNQELEELGTLVSAFVKWLGFVSSGIRYFLS